MVEYLLFRTCAGLSVLSFGESCGDPSYLLQGKVVAFDLGGPMDVICVGILYQFQIIVGSEDGCVKGGIKFSDLLQHVAVFQREGQHRLERYLAAVSYRIA